MHHQRDPEQTSTLFSGYMGSRFPLPILPGADHPGHFTVCSHCSAAFPGPCQGRASEARRRCPGLDPTCAGPCAPLEQVPLAHSLDSPRTLETQAFCFGTPQVSCPLVGSCKPTSCFSLLYLAKNFNSINQPSADYYWVVVVFPITTDICSLNKNLNRSHSFYTWKIYIK